MYSHEWRADTRYMIVSAAFICENLLIAATFIKAAVNKDQGQTLAEYGLLLALVAVGVVLPTLLLMRGALAGAYGDVTDCILGVTC